MGEAETEAGAKWNSIFSLTAELCLLKQALVNGYSFLFQKCCLLLVYSMKYKWR
jgi:hypothetical protein